MKKYTKKEFLLAEKIKDILRRKTHEELNHTEREIEDVVYEIFYQYSFKK